MKDKSAVIYTDGASRGNPGRSAWAYIILNNGIIETRNSGYCAYATNNQAEYYAVIHALSDAEEQGFRNILLYSDSQLIIRQLRGEYKVRDRCLRDLYMKTIAIVKKFDSVSFENVPRSNKNISIADRMCNETLDRMQKSDTTPFDEDIVSIPEIKLKPVGIVRSPYTTPGDAPRQGQLSDQLSEIHIFPEYRDALYTIEQCRQLVVLCWFDRAERSLLRATPPGQTGERGVFSIRSPGRPNPIALELVDLVQISGTVLTVRGLDAIDNTPFWI
ncbi:tRNA (N6-threonylcarbamoyladenosine(37)-N6)-methyltransferase TrmO [Methanogenium sp. MK-MG]|uniref:tRNA (N6-threonylcarbamoyladenosine(37)-N6)-methyltransferase TrmO n=1 Tax=Methanogenium sp. MK-MG TaxID=2599926 RepID=UPI0020B16DB9|nr:tRNA (N6-threonylcarbamoyladenosine(37)-N6)-methyltransferase TrmO [Methanogenium sp. MK-MG]KAF1078104.1 Ribonuclease H [Methanogenium sp. MK-MG]